MKVFVENLTLTAFHGVSEAENSVGQRLRIDLSAEISETASQTDRIEETVDYAALALRAVELCNESVDRTLEFVCERIGRGLLTDYPRIDSISIRVAKINPPLTISIGAVGVEKGFARPLPD